MTTLVIGIDPGVRALGWAIARIVPDRVIVAAGCSRPKIADGHPLGLATWAELHTSTILDACYRVGGGGLALRAHVESMAYVSARATTPQDLIDVQTVGCLVARALSPNVKLHTPQEWKGSVPKYVDHARLLAAPPAGPLDLGETCVVADALRACGAKRHHKEILDAVGILIHGLGRSLR